MTRIMAALIAAFAIVAILPSQAEARHHRHHYRHHRVITDRIDLQMVGGGLFNVAGPSQASRGEIRHRRYAEAGQIVSHPSGCPRTAFCGCGVSVKVFGHPIRGLYLAANWFRFPHASPGPGMVAVRNHHVMYIESLDGNGNATVYDPNSGGHQTRVHTRSLSGYSIRNPNGAKYASR